MVSCTSRRRKVSNAFELKPDSGARELNLLD